MNARKLVLGAVAAFVVMFALSWVWHEALMADFYQMAEYPMRDSPMMWAVAAGYGVLALLMAWIYPKGYEGGASWVEGAKFGAVIGILWIVPWQLIMYGVMEGSMSMVWVDGGWHIVEQGLGGIALALVHGGGAEEGMGTSPATEPRHESPTAPSSGPGGGGPPM